MLIIAISVISAWDFSGCFAGEGLGAYRFYSLHTHTFHAYFLSGIPNVPLMRIRGCINYNPVLAQRQFGYPIRGAPTPAVLVPIVCYYQDGFVSNTLCQIRNAWKNILCAERDTRSWSIDRESPYQQWLLDRVREVKLPYRLMDQEVSEEPVPKEPTVDTKSEEIQKLKEEVEQLKKKNDVLNNDM